MFKYKHLQLSPDEVQEKLTELGADGWRLCSFEPVVIPGNYDSAGHISVQTFSHKIHIVMDLFVQGPDAETEVEPEAMEMKS